ncbi:olfactory receptor 6F1-like [Bufo gargarizans]|uniref:olfactory receptor 6F1-like n=1 Tax=Bufo gargarizans TaxID=30331 RepID=UPI001CF11315|nr:olfactory receptor 6F1-like [Bufo gargarizans]
MPVYNQTTVYEFILLGFPGLHTFWLFVFLILLIIYVVTMFGNLLIIGLVSSTSQLQSPMYIFLTHLSVCDILISTNVGPNTLRVIASRTCYISALSCDIQLYFFGASALIESALLSVMSYDRYLAICNPLHYAAIMNHTLPHSLAMTCWLAGFLLSMITEILIFQLDFCGPNIIDHFFCDLAPLLQLSCSDTKSVEIHVSVTVMTIVFTQLLFVIGTYICIFSSILQLSSTSSRQKVFSTCSSHLMVVSTYYGTLIALYVAPSRGYSLNLNKMLSLLNTIVTPLCNPIIYSLRNKEIKIAISKIYL